MLDRPTAAKESPALTVRAVRTQIAAEFQDDPAITRFLALDANELLIQRLRELATSLLPPEAVISCLDVGNLDALRILACRAARARDLANLLSNSLYHGTV